MPGRISELVALTGALTAADDRLEISDTSAGTAGSKSITIAELLVGLAAVPKAGATMTGPLIVQGATSAIQTTLSFVDAGVRKGGKILWTGKAADMTAQLGQYDFGWEFLFTPGPTVTALESSIVEFGVPKWFSIRSSLTGIGPILAVRDNFDAMDLNFRMNRDTKYGEIWVGNSEGSDVVVAGFASLGLKFGVSVDGSGTYVTTYPFVIPGDGTAAYFTTPGGLCLAFRAGGAASPRTLFGNDNTDLGNISFNGGTGTGWLNALDTIRFGTGNSLPETNERMRITATGLVGIGGTPNAAAILDVASTTLGFLPPRMTTAQRDLIASPPAGLCVFNSTTGKLNVRGASAWEAVTSA